MILIAILNSMDGFLSTTMINIEEKPLQIFENETPGKGYSTKNIKKTKNGINSMEISWKKCVSHDNGCIVDLRKQYEYKLICEVFTLCL